MADYDYYDIKHVKRRRRIKNTILAIITGAVVIGGVKHFGPNLISKFTKEQPTTEETKEDNIVIYDEPVVTDEEVEEHDYSETDNFNDDNTYYDEDYEYYDDYEDTNAEVSHNIESRVATLMNAYIYYDPALEYTLPSEQELANMIDFMNGDYEVSTREEAEAMYDKLFDYYVVMLNSDPYIKRVNEHAETLVDVQESNGSKTYTLVKPTTSTYSGNAFNCNLTDVILASKNIAIYPVLARIDGLHKIVLSSNDVEIRDAALEELDEIFTDMYYGGVEIDNSYYSFDDLLDEDYVAAASLMQQYVYDLVPFLANLSGSNYKLYGNLFNGGDFTNAWEENLIEANMDGDYSYTLK